MTVHISDNTSDQTRHHIVGWSVCRVHREGGEAASGPRGRIRKTTGAQPMRRGSYMYHDALPIDETRNNIVHQHRLMRFNKMNVNAFTSRLPLSSCGWRREALTCLHVLPSLVQELRTHTQLLENLARTNSSGRHRNCNPALLCCRPTHQKHMNACKTEASHTCLPM